MHTKPTSNLLLPAEGWTGPFLWTDEPVLWILVTSRLLTLSKLGEIEHGDSTDVRFEVFHAAQE